MLATENWCVKVEEKVYGPYTNEQMRKFAHEGRLAAWSMIAPAGAEEWREARKEKNFAQFFGQKQSPQTFASNSDRAFGRRDQTAKKQDSTAAEDVQTANFIVVFDVVSASATRNDAAIQSLGPAFKIADNVWHITCNLTAIGVRNAIAPYLNRNESIFVIDATRGRTSWQNYAPGLHAKITEAHQTAR